MPNEHYFTFSLPPSFKEPPYPVPELDVSRHQSQFYNLRCDFLCFLCSNVLALQAAKNVKTMGMTRGGVHTPYKMPVLCSKWKSLKHARADQR